MSTCSKHLTYRKHMAKLRTNLKNLKISNQSQHEFQKNISDKNDGLCNGVQFIKIGHWIIEKIHILCQDTKVEKSKNFKLIVEYNKEDSDKNDGLSNGVQFGIFLTPLFILNDALLCNNVSTHNWSHLQVQISIPHPRAKHVYTFFQ